MAQSAAFVIGMGEVGRRLAGALERAGWTVRPVTRDGGWDAALDSRDPAPRILAMREEELGAAVERFAPEMRERIVLVQNGFLETVLGPLGPVTRGLIWFTSKGSFFRVLGPSEFHGPRAGTLAPALQAGGIDAVAIDDDAAFLRAMIVKGIWNCVVGLPLAAHGVDLGTYLREHRAEAESVVAEGARAAGAEYGVAVSAADAFRVLVETTRPLGWVRGGAKALPFRNGAIARFGRRHGIPTPVTDRLLACAGD